MKTVRLEIASIKRLDQINDALLNRKKLSENQTEELVDFISNVLSTAKEFADGVIGKTELNPSIELQIADTRTLLIHL